MKALSLLQPYAGLVVCDPTVAPRKIIENRGRVIFRPPRGGVWLALHASLGRWKGDDTFGERMDAVFPGWRNVPDVRGSLLGIFHVTGIRTYETILGKTAAERAARDLGPQAFGPVCYTIDDARPLPTPLPCKGSMGLWTVHGENLSALRALVPA